MLHRYECTIISANICGTCGKIIFWARKVIIMASYMSFVSSFFDKIKFILLVR